MDHRHDHSVLAVGVEWHLPALVDRPRPEESGDLQAHLLAPRARLRYIEGICIASKLHRSDNTTVHYIDS